MNLTRHTDLCQNSEWLNAQLASDNARVIALWSQRNLVRMNGGHPEPVYLSISDAALLLGNAVEVIYLGHDGEVPVFAADLGELAEKELKRILDHAAPGTEMINLRDIGAVLDPVNGSIFAYARGLAFWHQQNGFCARCGNPTHSRRGGHMRYCEYCSKEIFPRIDPAVIMLVEQHDPEDGVARCLLGRSGKWRSRMYSTLAGFVDSGESLEQAVIREVMEEAGLRVFSPVYIASQPWPFPSSLMLGFRARTRDRTITADPEEMEDVGWFSREQLRALSDPPSDQDEILLPPRDSIARLLIDNWLSEQ